MDRNEQRFIPDAESIEKDDEVRAFFRVPPGLAIPVVRNTLLIGAGGSGKTMFLKYAEATHRGFALRLDLADVLGPIQKTASIGPLSSTVASSVASLLAGKAAALVAIAVAIRLVQSGIGVRGLTLSDCLPEGTSLPNAVDEAALRAAQRALAPAPLDTFSDLAQTARFREFMNECGVATKREHGPLLLLLDRGDVAPPAALDPLLSLLDQSSGYLAILAARPGFIVSGTEETWQGGTPSDHYNILQLGQSPRSVAWRDFFFAAIRAQTGDQIDRLSEELQQFVFWLSRDSVRMGGLLAEWGWLGTAHEQRNVIEAEAERVQQQRLEATATKLRPYHPDFGDFVSRISQGAESDVSHVRIPVLVQPEYAVTELFPQQRDVLSFISAALREGGLCLADGLSWAPGFRPRLIEVPPVFLWSKTRQLTFDGAPVAPIPMPRREVFASYRGRPADPAVFIAYAFDLPASAAFRTRVEKHIRSDVRLLDFECLDGHIPGGRWIKAIEKRLARSRVVIADLTSLRPAVMFEVGFAWGRGKPIVGVIASRSPMVQMPEWLTELQIFTYDSDAGYNSVVEATASALREDFVRLPAAPRPVPERRMWIRFRDDSDDLDKANTILTRQGRGRFDEIDPGNGRDAGLSLGIETARECVKAPLLVAGLRGTDVDAFVHFVAGAATAKADASVGGRTLQRRILLVEQPNPPTARAAQNLRRCAPRVLVVKRGTPLLAAVGDFARRYEAWARQ